MSTPFEHGLVGSGGPPVRTGKRIAVVGGAAAGLAAALPPEPAGHKCHRYERSDCPADCCVRHSPMKLDKYLSSAVSAGWRDAGIRFCWNSNVGRCIRQELLEEYDRVLLTGGGVPPRDLTVPGRDAKEFCSQWTFVHGHARPVDSDFQQMPYELAQGKRVLVIGGGDTGNDCVGTVPSV